ncbi:DUF4394 domain-containing protein [Kitasatospora sp. NPDC057223]|uniref:DUF4394 domain-containing protein n=1 Tax=Kitasatospora sp. NPDC057223 TaxID=3346055 RepID=UPI003642956B
MLKRSALLPAAALLVAAALAAPAAFADGMGPAAAKPQKNTASGEEHGHHHGHHHHNPLWSLGLTTDHDLVAFATDHPEKIDRIGSISGLEGDQHLVGIDYRVQNGKLYGVGDKGGIYTVSDDNADAKKVSQLTIALEGTSFGVDFNPAANRLRVISDTGQNLRHNIDDPNGAPAAGTTVADATLTNPPVPPATTGTTAKGVTGAAYTNNDTEAATATTLFDIDTTADRVSLQSPANAGSLAPTGSLGIDADNHAGFDIYYNPEHHTNTGYASLGVGGERRFYKVDVLTGTTYDLGAFPQGYQVVDVALPLDQG